MSRLIVRRFPPNTLIGGSSTPLNADEKYCANKTSRYPTLRCRYEVTQPLRQISVIRGGVMLIVCICIILVTTYQQPFSQLLSSKDYTNFTLSNPAAPEVLELKCKALNNKAIQKEFRSIDYLTQNIPDQSMLNTDCVKALRESIGVDNYSILEEQICRHRFLFISGMHYSGTSVTKYLIQFHEQVSGHNKTGVNEDEGQLLQNEYPQANKLGGQCKFELNDTAYFTKDMVTSNGRRCIFSQWSKYWDLSQPLLLEKSPPTITQLGYRESLFPGVTSNLIIVRHPLYPCFWHFNRRKRGLHDDLTTQILRDALDVWLKTHTYLITESLLSLSSHTPNAIIMAEDFLSKDDAPEKLLELPSLLFPKLFVSRKDSGRNLELRRNKFDPMVINGWMADWDMTKKAPRFLYEEKILPILEMYEERCNLFGYSLLDVSKFNHTIFRDVFSLDSNNLYQGNNYA